MTTDGVFVGKRDSRWDGLSQRDFKELSERLVEEGLKEKLLEGFLSTPVGKIMNDSQNWDIKVEMVFLRLPSDLPEEGLDDLGTYRLRFNLVFSPRW
jgi:hypothetical protein